MILTIKGANFSTAGIGTLNTVSIKKTLGRGITHNIPNFINKDASANWTLTLGENYEFGTYSVTMGGTTITPTVSGNTMTISISKVTAVVNITVATTYIGTEEEPPVTPKPEQPGTGGGSGENQYYTLTHGNDYNATYMDAKNRVSIQPYTITVPTGVTITPKTGYVWAWMNNVDPDNMPSGSGGSWCGDTYTGTGKQIGITFKKSDDSDFDFSTDSIYASDYFDVSDSSIWIVDNSTPSEPSTPSGENTDLSTLTLKHGNPFGTTAQQSDATRANSTTNAYLLEGTTISLKDNVTYKWALKKVTSKTGATVDSTFNSGNYVPDPVWSTKKSYTITKSGYYRIILLKSDNSAFDWGTDSNIVSNYFELS
jgi:hypothetical protein